MSAAADSTARVFLTAREIHAALASSWPDVLAALGIDRDHLRNRHGPCPACGGTDRFRFDNKHQRGDWLCSNCDRAGDKACGAGDGFRLLELVHGWTFAEARREVMAVAGLREPDPDKDRENRQRDTRAPVPRETPKPEIARPTARVREVLRTSTTPDTVPDAIAYLRSRKLWPLPAGCTWRAHVGVDYYRPLDGKAIENVGRYQALVAAVRDLDGELVTAHCTYLRSGAKFDLDEPRKLFSKLIGRTGCAVRLMPLDGDVLGVAEGIETSIAASMLHDGVSVWPTLNAGLLAKFVPPPEVRRVIVFADRDVAGLEAAWHLRDRLGERCTFELRLPPVKFGDWCDVLKVRA